MNKLSFLMYLLQKSRHVICYRAYAIVVIGRSALPQGKALLPIGLCDIEISDA